MGMFNQTELTFSGCLYLVGGGFVLQQSEYVSKKGGFAPECGQL